MGRFLVDKSTAGVDPSLLGWIQAAAASSPYDVRFESGKREGDPRFHGKGMATDIQLIDPKTGKVIPNYQSPENFAAYQGFANAVHQAAGGDPRLRWGGYFSGGKGRYGALDLMHFDLGGQQVGMAGGGWGTGLTSAQAKIWGLQPGQGGSTVASQAPAKGGTVADTLAGAVDPRSASMAMLAPNPWKDFAITDAAPKRGGLVGAGSAGSLTATPGGDPGIPPLETASATVAPTPQMGIPPRQAPVEQLGQLADLFKVGPIGQAPLIGQAQAQQRQTPGQGVIS
jgi:hypothetical protein